MFTFNTDISIPYKSPKQFWKSSKSLQNLQLRTRSGSRSGLKPHMHCWVASVLFSSLQPMKCSLPNSSVHRILQAKILEWVAMLFSRGPSQPRDESRISWISCIGSQVLYHKHHLGKPSQVQILPPAPISLSFSFSTCPLTHYSW